MEGKDWVAEGMGREMGFENHLLAETEKSDRGPREKAEISDCPGWVLSV